jgi:hypothetical protein
MKLNPLVLLKNVVKWVFKFFLKAGESIADAEERFWKDKFNESK